MKQICAYLNFKKACERYINKHNVDYIHCHDLDGAIIGMFLKCKNIIFDMHERYLKKKSKIVDFLVKIQFNICQNNAKKIIYVNYGQLNEISKKNENKLIYLPNFPQKSMYEPIEKEASDNIRINYVGCVRNYKALSMLFDVSNAFNNVSIGVFGSGTDYNRVKEYAEKFENVILYGAYDGETQSSNIYRNTDVLFCVYDKTHILHSQFLLKS